MNQKDQRRQDHELYERLLEETRDSNGVRHVDQARKRLAEELASDVERIAEFAEARAERIARASDEAHDPKIEDGQLRLDVGDRLTIADNERVPVTEADGNHTRQYLDIQARNHARVTYAWGLKDMHFRRVLAVQDERDCTVWEAEEILRGDA